jgi:hypothetical protein
MKTPVSSTTPYDFVSVELRKAAELQANALKQREAILTNLAPSLGFTTNAELIAAIQALPKQGKAKTKAKAAKPVAKKPQAAKPKVKKPRAVKAAPVRKPKAVITPEIKAKVAELVKAHTTANKIAEQLHISTPSVNNIKRELGLTKARPKDAPAPADQGAPAPAAAPAAPEHAVAV